MAQGKTFGIHRCARIWEGEARKRPEAMRLMTHPGVGPLTALAYVLIERRGLDGASRSLKREFELVIVVEVLIEEMFGSD